MKKILLTLIGFIFSISLSAQVYDDIYYKPPKKNTTTVIVEEPTIIVNNHISFEDRINRFHRNNFRFHVTYYS